MAKQLVLPREAFDDVCTLVRLTDKQLTSLGDLFATGESVNALRTVFIDRVAETLGIGTGQARSVVVVTHILLLRPRTEESEGYVDELLDDLRSFLEESATEADREAILADFDQKRPLFASLATPKQERLRAQKIRRLARGPERTVESVRTICQLRPMYEGPEHAEQIVGLVPVILLEIKTEDADGEDETFAFGLDSETVTSLGTVIERTKEKLKTIREKYGPDLLTE